MSQKYYPPTSNALQKTLGAALDTGTTSAATLNNATGIQNKAGVFVVDRVDSNGTVKSAANWEWISFAGVSGSTVTTLVRGLNGSTDQDHATGAIVEFCPDATWAQGVMDALDNLVTSACALDTTKVVDLTTAQTLTTKTLTTPVIASFCQDAAKTKVMTTPNTASDTLAAIAATQTLTNKTVVQRVASYTPDAAGTATLDLTTGGIQKITMPDGNITIAISNEAVGQCFLIEITQDGTGSRTVTWFSTIKWAGGSAPTLTTTASKRDTFGFRVTGTDTYDGFIVGQNV
jgi:hypothetical protein